MDLQLIIKEVAAKLDGCSSTEEVIARLDVNSKREYELFIGGIASAKSAHDALKAARYVNLEILDLCKSIMNEDQIVKLHEGLIQLQSNLDKERDGLTQAIVNERAGVSGSTTAHD